MTPDQITQAVTLAKARLLVREGKKLTVYKDSKGKLTGGIGHLLEASVGYRYKAGDRISEELCQSWFQMDVDRSLQAALHQLSQLKPEAQTPEFLAALISVNFQLGTNWTDKFYETWPLLKEGNYTQATDHLLKSDWYLQTPARVIDFISAIVKITPPKEPLIS